MGGHGISRAQGAIAALACAAILAPLLVLAAAPARTNDLWFHLAAGRSYVQEGLWPEQDPMLHTAHEDAPVQHEWLFGVGTWALHQATGFGGLRIAHVIALLGSAGLALLCFRRAGAAGPVALAGTAAFLALGWWRLVQFRPDLLSIPATLATYSLLLAGDRAPSRGQIGAVAAIALVWANVHSLFALGPALVFAALLGVCLNAALARSITTDHAAWARALGLSMFAMLGVAILNPRGIAQHATFFSSTRDTAIWQISDEWRHLDPFRWPEVASTLSPLAWLLADLSILGAFVLASARFVAWCRDRRPERLERLDTLHLGLAAAGAVAMLSSIRFLWMGIFPLLYLARALPWPSRVSGFAVATLACLIAVALPGWGGLRGRANTLMRPANYFDWRFDARALHPRAVLFLMESGVTGNLFNRYTHGGFVGYWLAPRVRTFVDGRTEHYPPEVLEDYFRIANQLEVQPGESALEALDRRGVDLYFGVGVPVAGERVYTTARLDGAPGWIPIARSIDYSIFLRKNERNRANLERVESFYSAAGVPFDRERGFDPLVAARARPDWAIAQGIVPEDYSSVVDARTRTDPRERAPALERLALLLYLLGAYDAQISLDRESIGLRPDAIEPRRRLVMSLLRLGHIGEAALQVSEVARVTGKRHPTVELLRLVKEVEQLSIEAGPVPPDSAINALPVASRTDLLRLLAGARARQPEFPESPRG